MDWLDEYTRKARLVPGLLVVVPVAIVVVAVGLRDQPVIAFIGSLLGTIGFPVLLANTVRDMGLQTQDRLYRSWSGEPTTICLRHGGDATTAVRRARWRDSVSRVVGRPLPTAEEERRDPVSADGEYAAAVAKVRELTRDAKVFPLVFAENKNYGFERNLRAVRSAGLGVSGIAALVLILSLFASWGLRGGVAVALLAAVALGAMWWFFPTDDRVRRVAFRYAERLLDTADVVKIVTT